MIDYRTRIGKAIAYARTSVDVSQQELAELLKRDKRTIQKWEKGAIKISLEDFLEVFQVLQLPAGPYAKWIRHPELFPKGLDDIRRFSLDQKRMALTEYYRQSASPEEIEQEYYVLFGSHGSNYYGMRQQRIANLQTPLRDRRRICGQIIDNYMEALAIGQLADPDGPKPNMEILMACFDASGESIRNGKNRYSIGSIPTEGGLSETENEILKKEK